MLVLERHPGEVICIGNDIKVTVTRIRGDRVKLGITAPAEMRVDREEVRERIDEQKAEGRR